MYVCIAFLIRIQPILGEFFFKCSITLINHLEITPINLLVSSLVENLSCTITCATGFHISLDRTSKIATTGVYIASRQVATVYRQLIALDKLQNTICLLVEIHLRGQAPAQSSHKGKVIANRGRNFKNLPIKYYT